jgi:cobalt transporter subunit CbtB
MRVAIKSINLLVEKQANTIVWSKVYAVFAAVIIGVFIISTVGFAGSEILHNAAHDVRHGLSFPCH